MAILTDSSTLHYVRGDTSPPLKFLLTEEDTDAPVNLSGATVVLSIRVAGCPPVLFTREGTITGIPGEVIVHWQENDLNLPGGIYQGEISVARGDGTDETVYETIRLKIRDDFGPAAPGTPGGVPVAPVIAVPAWAEEGNTDPIPDNKIGTEIARVSNIPDVDDWALNGNTDTIPDSKLNTTIARRSSIPDVEQWALHDDTDPIPDSKLNTTIARTADIPSVADWASSGNTDIIPVNKIHQAYRGTYNGATIYQHGDIIQYEDRFWLNVEIPGAGVQGIPPSNDSTALWKPFYVPESVDLTRLSSEVDHLQALTHQITVGAPGDWETASVGGLFGGAPGVTLFDLTGETFTESLSPPFPDTEISVYVVIPQVAEGDTHFRVTIEGAATGQAFRIPFSQWVSLGAGPGGVQYYRATAPMIIGSDTTRIILEQYPDQGGTTFTGKVARLAPWAEVGATDRPRLGWVNLASITIATINSNARAVLEPEEATKLFSAITGGEYAVMRTAAGNPAAGDDSGQFRFMFDTPVVHDSNSVASISGLATGVRGQQVTLIIVLTSGQRSRVGAPNATGEIIVADTVANLINNHGGAFIQGLTTIFPEG